MSESVQFLKFVISGDDAELAEVVARSRKTVTGLFDVQTAGAKRLVDSSVYVNGWRESLLEASGAEQRMSATALFEAQHQSAKKLATDAGYVDFWVNALHQQEAAEKKVASDNAFLKSLQDRSSQIGKTTADILEMQAAERGLSAQAAPMIAQLRQAEKSFGATGVSAAQTAAAMRMVPAQFTDIVVSLQGGQQPLTVLLQQGGQLKDMFGGTGAAAKALAGYILGLVNPYTVAAGAVGVLALAYYQGSREADRMRAAVIESGNASGVTMGQMRSYATSIDGVIGTHGKAVEAITAMVAAGVRGGDQLRDYSEAAIRWERATGTAVDKTAEKFGSLQNEPLKATLKLNEGTNYLTSSVYLQIKALEEQGRTTEAAQVAQKAFADSLVSRSDEMVKHLGLVERSWIAIKDAIKDVWDLIKSVGRESATEDLLKKQQETVDNLRMLADRSPWNASIKPKLAAAEAHLDVLRKQQATEKETAAAESARAVNLKATEKWEALLDQHADNQAKKKKALLKLETEYQNKLKAVGDDPTARKRVDQEYLQLQKATEEQYKDKGAAAGAKREQTAYETLIASIRTKVDEVKKELEVERELTDSQKIRAKLDNDVAAGRLKLSDAHRKNVEAALADLQAQEKLADARKGRKLTDQLLSENSPLAPDFAQQWRQIGAAYDGTAESLDRLTQAQAVLLAKQPFAQQATAIAQARAEAEQYLATMQRAQGREVQLVGMGGRSREYFNGINQIEDTYASKRYDLGRDRERERVRSGGELPQKLKDYYDQQFALNDEFERKAKASYSSTFEAIGQAQSNWVNGATRAFDDYAASAANAAEQTAGVFNRLYSGFEDNAISFAMTGKTSFKDYAQSVISDLIRIQLRAQMVSILGGTKGSGLLGTLISGVTSLFGGGMQAAGVQASGAETMAVSGWGSVSGVDLGPVAGGRANGGPVTAGNLYEVNERKIPELLNIGDQQFLMMAGADGYVTPLQSAGSAPAGSGQSAPVRIDLQVINQGAPVQAQVQSQNRADGSVAIKLFLNAVAEDMAGGGVTARATRQRFNLQEA
ncbi:MULTISPECIES: phage tail tape measure protein [unclassified Comamonas]|uniref:phage tail tape measure protein n=1 Tax=unclassified Comamonas TaxID=2638500 RepID=UPI001FA7D5E5|nr:MULTISPECIES: phage tail tape measure protein [unclassified Comamonas]UNV89377.1 phage tail tape measure protein [Comamonas sp. 7D-2evo1]UNV97325.1 phage tail tape measure protein [Comamonas sp. 7D-2]UNV99021.1 phage tail tape measure protein [Comamonas sp. 7D-2evo2]